MSPATPVAEAEAGAVSNADTLNVAEVTAVLAVTPLESTDISSLTPKFPLLEILNLFESPLSIPIEISAAA